jgi:hypothetical protein
LTKSLIENFQKYVRSYRQNLNQNLNRRLPEFIHVGYECRRVCIVVNVSPMVMTTHVNALRGTVERIVKYPRRHQHSRLFTFVTSSVMYATVVCAYGMAIRTDVHAPDSAVDQTATTVSQDQQ